MTAYRDPPLHCLPRKFKPVSWWRRFKAQRKARRWYAALLKTSAKTRFDVLFRRLEKSLKSTDAIGRNLQEMQRTIDRIARANKRKL